MVIDDHHLLAALAGIAADDVLAAQASDRLYTTFGWYHRLACALRGTGAGVLTESYAALAPEVREEIDELIDDLRGVAILPAEVVVPVGADLHARGLTHNQLNTEALAACLVLEAPMVVAVVGDRTRHVADEVGVRLDVRAPLPAVARGS